MFDIETLSTFPNAAIIAVGIAIRDDKTPKHVQARGWFIDRTMTIGHENRETLEWWDSQDPRVRNPVFAGNQIPREVFQEVNGFLQSNGINQDAEDVRCYASPAMFDFPILRYQYQQLGLLPAWHWRKERCLSTMMKEVKDNFDLEIVEIEPELKHHPVHDCLAQFKELDACLAVLKSYAHNGRNRGQGL